MQFNPNDRHILVISGEREESLNYAKKISSKLDSVEIVDESTKALGFLGQELDAIIFDMHQKFYPNAFGAVTGAIRGGGFLILLRSVELPNGSLFLSRFYQILESTSQVHFLRADEEQCFLLATPSKKSMTNLFATTDQEKAVKAIVKVVTGHRRRPLVITSDRGRGKSASLGIAATELAKQGIKNIIVCAPSKKSASMVFKHAENNADTHTEYNLSFFSPDDLQLQKLSADLVLIDEAAAIPIPLLTDFLKHYSRIVFSSTQHGYEGSGRGFAINFRKVLDREAPEWKSCELKQPIRWQENDTLEQFTFDALLLNAEAADDSLINKVTVGDCDFKQIDKQQLIKNNEKLKQLFGLLVSAHYQTKPSDLMQLLDDDSVSVYCLEANEQVVAVALLIQEGNIDAKLAKDIFAGNRRIPGHLVAQALSSNVGIESATQLSGERISRIAVHPSLQGMGLGSFLIDKLIKRSSADYLSTCYGATESLLHFWQKNNFLAVHIGIKRDASSGAHSVTMLHSKSNKGELLCGQAQSIFAQNFPHLLSDTLSELESEIVSSLLPEYPVKGLDDEEKKILCAFANESRGYENSLYLIYDLVLSNINKSQKLNEQEKKLLITKVLQKQSWQKMQQKWGGVISGKKQALALTRQAVLKLI